MEKDKIEHRKSAWNSFVIIQKRDDCGLNNRGSIYHGLFKKDLKVESWGLGNWL